MSQAHESVTQRSDAKNAALTKAPAGPEESPAVPRSVALPSLHTRHAPQEALAIMEKAARRGRLPGYEALPAENGAAAMFEMEVYGSPFDRRLIGVIEGGAEGESRRIIFHTKIVRKLPAMFIGAIIISIWPGLPLVDGLIPSSWGWWPTWTWYIPMCLAPIPFMPRMWRKSEDFAHNEAHKAVRKVARELDAELVNEVTPT